MQDLSDGVRRLLVVLGSTLPRRSAPPRSCMADDDIPVDSRRWVFEVGCGEPSTTTTTFFVTTFAPFYPTSSPRRSLDPDWSFVLLQPEVSFARHDLPLDHGDNGDDDVRRDVRDRIRAAFREAGKPYRVPECPSVSVMAHEVVRPFNELEGDVVEWWKCRNSKKHS